MDEFETVVADAESAVEHARRVREHHRRRTDKESPQRRADIELALERLKAAMAPLRSHLGRFPYLDETAQNRRAREAMLEISQEIQTQRRKLWKMK
jgi:hypothetical protein